MDQDGKQWRMPSLFCNRMEMKEAKKIAEEKRREKVEERLARSAVSFSTGNCSSLISLMSFSVQSLLLILLSIFCILLSVHTLSHLFLPFATVLASFSSLSLAFSNEQAKGEGADCSRSCCLCCPTRSREAGCIIKGSQDNGASGTIATKQTCTEEGLRHL